MGGRTVRLIADTNILLRLVLNDDPVQAEAAQRLMEDAELICIPVAVLCEFVWTLRRGYKRPVGEVIDLITDILDTDKVTTDQPAVEAGLALLRAGGDFGDGVIAHQGFVLGGTSLASFDKKAVNLVSNLIGPAFVPGQQ